ncbi:hypothetical protein FAVG1_08646 [Fusarium avenaceum]|nr:hypothetical protein FAVG1_08646 [Fusarium avenaceum]
MEENREQELSHLLLTELLAIETQDVLLKDKDVHRMVEIGPSNTLVSMAKKTISRKYHEHDAALPKPRTLQSYQEDASDICYERKASRTPPAEPQTAQEVFKSNGPYVSDTRNRLPKPDKSTTVTMTSKIDDEPIAPGDVVVAIVAQKLRKKFGEIDCLKSIKSLCGGRSTMENEIIGDLSVIFDPLPDRVEEMELSELSQILSGRTSVTKLMSVPVDLTTRVFTQNMPGEFLLANARAYLETRMATEPFTSRLESGKEAMVLLDTITKVYAAGNGLQLQPAMDNLISALAVEHQHELDIDLAPTADVIGLGNDSSSQLSTMSKLRKLINIAHAEKNSLQQRMDLLMAELGEEFVVGVLPAWCPHKIRKYESCWNWAIQDLLILVNSILCGETNLDCSQTGATCDMIVRRSNERLLSVMRFMLNSESLRGDEFSQTSRFFPQGLQPRRHPMATYVSGIVGLDQKKANEDANDKDHKVMVKIRSEGIWEYDTSMTELYQSSLTTVRRHGLRLKRKTVLITGAGSSSIGRELLQQLLMAGARVLALYMRWGSSGSQLIISPFNQGSKGDCENLVRYVFDPKQGLGWDLDYVVPFAAVSEVGQVDECGSKAEIAHRIMLTNILRLLGAIKQHKKAGPPNTSPTIVLLPLSPNHGIFGGDGLYAESKVGLEMLLNKWYSEDWSSYLSICGAVIGWVRGTGLMAANDAVAAEVEARTGFKTFSQEEMAQHLAALLEGPFSFQIEVQPMRVDISGGMSTTTDLRSSLSAIRQDMGYKSISTSRRQQQHEQGEIHKVEGERPIPSLSPLANVKPDFPALPDYEEDIGPLSTLRGMVDLDRVVVITGISEVGPWGSSRTRWEMEACGEFSLEGCIEMAWIMGFINHHNGRLAEEAGGEHYVGWVDAQTGLPVADVEVKPRYESEILKHTGIRLVEPELDNGYDPSRKQLLHEIVLTRDLAPFTAPPDLAKQFIQEHGEKVDAMPGASDEADWTVHLRKGAMVLIPKALRFDRAVAGQIPKGWDARRYGVPDWAVDQIGRETIFSLVATAEALVSAGIVDPYELYQYMHVSEVGNCIGSGLGGQHALKKIFRHRYHDKPVQSDILQEVFINTTAAWINMLLLSSAGPLRTPVGACATAVESLELGYELITSGKAKVALVGGHDDMTEEMAFEFAKMRATVSSEKELKQGRVYSEMSRPMTTTRDGFVESQGSGMQVLANARTAIDMGLPIFGIVCWVGTASDRISRSVPSPGKGILTNAREASNGVTKNPLLDIRFRKDRITKLRQQIQADLQRELKFLEQRLEVSEDITQVEEENMKIYLHKEAKRRDKEILRCLGHEFWVSEPDISPLRGALSAWGLTIDDLDFVSLHGTSTVMNDKNETSVIQNQLSHLGRTQGNPVYSITQKYLTGHSKGAAGAWMINGALQALNSGLIPGNRNADDIDPDLEENDLIFFPHHSIQTNGLRACSITSFGFGQKGAQAIIIHPRYLYASLSDVEEFHKYKNKLLLRQRRATRFFQKGLATNTLFVAKEKPPYTEEQESRVLLNPGARMEGQHYKDI